MTEVELWAELERVQAIATIAGVTLLLVGLLLAAMPVGYCDECPHCRRTSAGQRMCPQHRKPKSQCEDEHRP